MLEVPRNNCFLPTDGGELLLAANSPKYEQQESYGVYQKS